LQFVLKAGDAKLLVRGSLLGEHQDASVLLTDFPMATLRPLFRLVWLLRWWMMVQRVTPEQGLGRPLGLVRV
jgi:hypothetical protein